MTTKFIFFAFRFSAFLISRQIVQAGEILTVSPLQCIVMHILVP